MVKAKIITIGDEILIGQIVDTNSAWIANELTQVGITVTELLSISDSKEAIIEALENALIDTDLIIFTGGLGPTKDDITKKTLAGYFNTPLVFSEDIYNDVKAFLSYRGSKLNQLNKDQALVPENATILRNAKGTAPGMWFEKKGKVIVSIPGVPTEMRGLITDQVLPRIKKQFNLKHIEYFTVLTTGMAEAHLAELLSDWEEELPGDMQLAYLPSPGMVRIRLGMAGDNQLALKNEIEKHVNKLKVIIGKDIFGYNKETLELIVGKLLKNRNKTVSVAESCTGGKIAHLFTTIPGSSAYFIGGTIAYQNEVKEKQLGVKPANIEKHGAVSEEVVKEMALGACQLFGTDYAIATSGIAGPEGGTREKPVGTVWVAVCGPKGVVAKKFKFGKEREINIHRTALAALNLLRKQILLNENI